MEGRAVLIFAPGEGVLFPTRDWVCPSFGFVATKNERLTPETCRGSRHNKVIVKVKVY
jgi:hypothetical protein